MRSVLVVDDKAMLRDSVGATLARAGFEVRSASGGEEALQAIAAKRPDAVVTDLRMPGMTGLELIERLGSIDADLPVVMMTAFGEVQTAVEAIKLGAFDYITKPFEGDELIIAVKRAIEHARLVRERAVLGASRAPDNGPTGIDRIIGESRAMCAVKEQLEAVASSRGTVLITGESGAGKEVVARAVHEMSPRGDGPMLAVNCAALSDSLLESELFGHERGAFTGAEAVRKGRFELADGGTLLLDEISEVSVRTQAKLLRVLQESAFERVGSSVTIGVDVRVVATSNRDLPGAVAAGDFRQDLYYRLNVLPIRLPALRERKEDIPLLAHHFLGSLFAREGHDFPGIEGEALALLHAYDWPGNVRELHNICERAAVLACGREVTADMVAGWLGASPRSFVSAAPMTPETPSPQAGPSATVIVEGRPLEAIEREAIVNTLRKFGGHRQRTAQSLGIGVRTLGLKLKKWKEMNLVEETL